MNFKSQFRIKSKFLFNIFVIFSIITFFILIFLISLISLTSLASCSSPILHSSSPILHSSSTILHSPIVINEILPNPEEYSDAEWVELFSNETLDLSNFSLNTTGAGQVYTFDNVTIYDFLIITKNKSAFLLLWPNVNESKIIEWSKMGLSNSGELVYLLNSNNQSNISNIIDNTTFPSFSSEQKRGESWARCENGTFVVCSSPTPGQENNCSCSQQSSQEESKIEIVDAPEEADFGSVIKIKLNFYRGDTQKYALYVYVQDKEGSRVSDKITLHADEKFQNYTKNVYLSLNCENESGTYEIVAEGLDVEDKKDIILNPCSNNQDNETNETENKTESGINGTTIGDFTYSLKVPNEIQINKEFGVNVSMFNKGDKEQSFLIWSYVYDGPKCYSCSNGGRESNAKEMIVKKNSLSSVLLTNIVQDTNINPGNYKLKVKILQEGLKTPKEFTYDIIIKKGDGNTKNGNTSINSTGSSNLTSTTKEKINKNYKNSYKDYGSSKKGDYAAGSVIESKNPLISKIMPYFLSSIALLFVIYLIIKKV